MSTLAYGNELWRSDGTGEGTFRLTDIEQGPLHSYPAYPTVVNETAYFNIFRNSAVELWKTDGSVEGTQRILVPDQGEAQQTAFTLTKYDDSRLAFVSNSEVWITDGTMDGTTKIMSLPDASHTITDMRFDTSVPGDEHAYLAMSQYANNSHSHFLVRFDIQTQTTTTLISGGEILFPIELNTVYNGRLIFNLTDAEHGRELWYSDGTPETTALWLDINPVPDHSHLLNFTIHGEMMYFFATSAETGREVWFIDGVNSLPQVIDIVPGADSFDPRYLGFADQLFVSSYYAIYRLDGAIASSIPDIELPVYLFPVPFCSASQQIVLQYSWQRCCTLRRRQRAECGNIGNVSTFLGTTSNGVVFIADDEVAGSSIWKTDGTATGTSLVLKPEQGTMSSYPTALTNINGNLAYFTSDSPFYTHNSDLLQVTGTNQLQVIDSDFEWVYGTETAIVQNGLQYQTAVGTSVQLSEWNGSKITRLTSSEFSGIPVPPLLQINEHRIVLLASPNSLSSPGSLWTIDSDGTLLEELAKFEDIDRESLNASRRKHLFSSIRECGWGLSHMANRWNGGGHNSDFAAIVAIRIKTMSTTATTSFLPTPPTFGNRVPERHH